MNPDLQPFLQVLDEKWARLTPNASIGEIRELSEVIASEKENCHGTGRQCAFYYFR